MKIRTVLAISAAVVGLAASPSIYAAPASVRVPVHAMFSKTKMIKLNLRNDSGAPMELKVGDQVIKLDAGKSIALNLPVGTRILANVATEKHEAASLIEEVSSQLNGVTIGIK